LHCVGEFGTVHFVFSAYQNRYLFGKSTDKPKRKSNDFHGFYDVLYYKTEVNKAVLWNRNYFLVPVPTPIPTFEIVMIPGPEP